MREGRQMRLNAQLTGGLGIESAAWRYPGQDPKAFMKVDSYIKAVKILERGKFDAFFIADTPALTQDISQNAPLGGLDPITILSILSQVTNHIGLVATLSSTYNEAYSIARQLRSLDLLSGGRIGWNVVTTSHPAAHANYGGQQLTRAQKYDRAYEMVDAVQHLWSSWAEDALILDTANNRFADIGKIMPIDYQGQHVQTYGPINLPPSPQGQPVIFSAGGGDDGLEIALRYGNAIYTNPPTRQYAIAYWKYVKQRLKAHHRNSDEFVAFNGLIISLGGTEEEALQKRRELDQMGPQADRIRYLGFMLSIDLSELNIDAPIPKDYRAAMHPNMQDLRAQNAYEMAKRGMTIRDILAHGPINYHPVLVGTPEQVADAMEEWFHADVGDGFSILPDTGVDALDDFVEHVIPILQRKKLFRAEYQGSTFRHNLGLDYFNEVRQYAQATEIDIFKS